MMKKTVKPLTPNPSLLPSSARFIKTRVTGNREIARDVFVISLERHFDFIPGQVVGIHLEPSPDARLYSIASGVDEPDIRLLFNIQPEGMLTPEACKIQGRRLFIREYPVRLVYQQ
jgi:ferredoxin/flavodoxin---NADP+ reductase